jgi:hypothetical protein
MPQLKHTCLHYCDFLEPDGSMGYAFVWKNPRKPNQGLHCIVWYAMNCIDSDKNLPVHIEDIITPLTKKENQKNIIANAWRNYYEWYDAQVLNMPWKKKRIDTVDFS